MMQPAVPVSDRVRGKWLLLASRDRFPHDLASRSRRVWWQNSARPILSPVGDGARDSEWQGRVERLGQLIGTRRRSGIGA